MGNFTLYRNINRYWKSVYRPILCSVRSTDADIAFCRGEIMIEQTWGSGTYTATGIVIDGHAKLKYTGVYEFNLMDHCRHFVSNGDFMEQSISNFQLSAETEAYRFKIVMWPVRYSGVLQNALYDDLPDVVESNVFIGVGATTHDMQLYNASHNLQDIDSLVLGDNGWINPPIHSFLTEMPTGTLNSPVQVMNRNEDRSNGLYTLASIDSVYDKFIVYYMAHLNGSFVGMTTIEPTVTSTFFKISLHPDRIEQEYLMNTGSALNLFVDASGNLVADTISVFAIAEDSSSTVQSLYPLSYSEENGLKAKWYHFGLTEEKNEGHCQKTKFIFKNHLGGYDFFNCYGTISKSVSTDGQEMESHYGLSGYSPSQQHTRKMLWTQREDSFNVFSQPLTTEKANWLADLIASPQVWVEEVIQDATSYSRRKIPVIIEPGSYNLHTTEDSVHFIQFQYTKSQRRTTQRT
tara:strand:- start:16069 stop:17454 length:1386 start_codon:yes stop_codon:yes gene_type:complete